MTDNTKARYTLAMNSTVAETGDKSATNLTVADMVNFVAGFGTNRQQLEFASLLRLTTRSTLSQIRSTLTPVCTGLTKLTVLNSTLSPACTGLIQYSESHTWGRLTYHKMKCIQATINNYHLQYWGFYSHLTSTKYSNVVLPYLKPTNYCYCNKCIGDDTKAAARQSPNCTKKPKNMKYGEKRFSTWRMEFLHPAMWHDHDIDFARWLHPAMWHVAVESWQWIHQVAAPCNVIRGSGMTCRWIHPVAAPCSVTHSSGIMTLNSPGGSTLQCSRWLWDDMPWNSPNVRHIEILHLVSILTISPQSTCHSAPVCKILSKSDHPQPKKWHVDFQDGRSQPSWILVVQ